MAHEPAATAPSAANATPTFSIRRELESLPPEARAACEQHLAALDGLLRASSPYALRDDSRLAYRFARGELPMWSPYAIAHEMACTQCLCDALPYQAALQPFLRALATRLKRESGADWTSVWRAVAELGPELLKLQMMDASRLYFPDFEGGLPPPLHPPSEGGLAPPLQPPSVATPRVEGQGEVGMVQ